MPRAPVGDKESQTASMESFVFRSMAFPPATDRPHEVSARLVRVYWFLPGPENWKRRTASEPTFLRCRGHQLAIRSLKQHQWRVSCSVPWHFHRQQIGRMKCQHVLFAFIGFSLARKTGKEEPLLSQRFCDAAGTSWR